MNTRPRAGCVAIAAGCLTLGAGASAPTQAQPADAAKKAATMPARASGTFEVKLTPQGTDDRAEGSTLGRMSSEKNIADGKHSYELEYTLPESR